MEKTYVMIKPGFDNKSKEIFNFILKKLWEKGDKNVSISHIKSFKLTPKQCDEHYAHLIGKDFYPHLKQYMLSGNVVAAIVEGKDIVNRVLEICGATKDPAEGTVRYEFGFGDVTRNVIHRSDSVEAANAEIKRFYGSMRDVEPDSF